MRGDAGSVEHYLVTKVGRPFVCSHRNERTVDGARSDIVEAAKVQLHTGSKKGRPEVEGVNASERGVN